MQNDLILFGPPGAGKGTQGALLADQLGLLRLSTGDVLREAVREGTAMGVKARGFMDAGELVPDEVILGIVKDYLTRPASDRGVIFDGFPRTLPQARGLEELLDELNRPLQAVLVLEVDDEVLIRRLSGRRSCPACGSVSNVYTNAPAREGRCDKCGGELILRPDDEPDTVRRRLAVYHEQTAPLVDFYAESATPLHRLDGARPVEQVQAELLELLA